MIRIRHPKGTSTFNVSDSAATLGELQEFIAAQSDIPAHEQELKTGYPPKPLHLSGQPSSTLLSSSTIGIKRGEQVIVVPKGSTSGSTNQYISTHSSSSAAPSSSSSSSSTAAPAVQSSIPTVQPAAASSSKSKTAPSFSTSVSGRGNAGTSDVKTDPASSTSVSGRESSSTSNVKTLSSSTTSSSSTPSASTSTANDISSGSISMPVSGGDQGFLTIKVVPDDNSCLFNSVGFLFSHSLGPDTCQGLRQVVADAIRQDPDAYPDVVLGQPRESYISKILTPNTWGGAIELSILSQHFSVEIDSIDVATGTIHRFGEDKGYSNRGIVLYSGIHYDALALLPSKNADLNSAATTTIFPSLADFGIGPDDDPILIAAKQLAQELKKRKYYTDTANFTLKCKVCGTKLTGEKEAVQHAKSTGHGDFGEV